jgi:hypothetical protein
MTAISAGARFRLTGNVPGAGPGTQLDSVRSFLATAFVIARAAPSHSLEAGEAKRLWYSTFGICRTPKGRSESRNIKSSKCASRQSLENPPNWSIASMPISWWPLANCRAAAPEASFAGPCFPA